MMKHLRYVLCLLFSHLGGLYLKLAIPATGAMKPGSSVLPPLQPNPSKLPYNQVGLFLSLEAIIISKVQLLSLLWFPPNLLKGGRKKYPEEEYVIWMFNLLV